MTPAAKARELAGLKSHSGKPEALKSFEEQLQEKIKIGGNWMDIPNESYKLIRAEISQAGYDAYPYQGKTRITW